MSRYWSPIVHDLKPYVPGEQPKIDNLVKLNTNENPYGPSPKVLAAINSGSNESLRLYPDPNSIALKKTIADYYQLDTAQVFVGNGSDEVLAHIFNALFQHDAPILFPDITYSFYPVYCRLYQIEAKTVALTDDFEIQIDAYMQKNGGIIFPNPNAPTGCLLALDDIERILKTNLHAVVVIDEAYIDFGGESAVTLIAKYPNLLVTQTLSKSRSLASMRIGFAMGHTDLIEALTRVKNSFNSYPLSSLAVNAGIAAFEDQDYFEETRQKIIASRKQMVTALARMGFNVLPSASNFVLVSHSRFDAAKLASGLREQGVLVRHFNQDRIKKFLRITVGTPEENQKLLTVLKDLVT